ncbi:MAG TPA: MazG nucleotide pyrophosphohydrolase domain-containing protein [Thermoleophilaceae bacterium]|nr:MazG nucleotide pyrophosphohydrolase domain-containing protein [Thermoleophilaceae bacterium]
MSASEISAAVARLDALTRRLRRECPWDREQDERSIVPHTVEEAYELADAAHSGDDAKLLDELGDVLFQVVFLSLLLEERGAGSLAEVADHCHEKLVRRHPHVFGDAQAESAAEVLESWSEIKRERERGGEVFGDLPENLPATLYAKKVLRRAQSAGLAPARGTGGGESPAAGDDAFDAIGKRLFEAVEAAGAAGVDPEIALRETARRFKLTVEESQAGTGEGA